MTFTGEYFEGRSTFEYNDIVMGYQMFARELSTVNREFSDLRCLKNSLRTKRTSQLIPYTQPREV